MPVRFASASDSVDFLPPCPPALDAAAAEDDKEDAGDELGADEDDDNDEDDEDEEEEEDVDEAEAAAEAEDAVLNANVEKSGRAATGRRWWCA